MDQSVCKLQVSASDGWESGKNTCEFKNDYKAGKHSGKCDWLWEIFVIKVGGLVNEETYKNKAGMIL